MNNVEFNDVDYKGRKFDRFYAVKSAHNGPGWYVYGRNSEYGDSLIHLCARPDVKPRVQKHYNVRVRRGWHTKHEAATIAHHLNQGVRP